MAGSSTTNFSMGGSAEYAIFRDRNTGYAVGGAVDVGAAAGQCAYAVTGHIAFLFGASEAYDVAPVGLVDALPVALPGPTRHIIRATKTGRLERSFGKTPH